MWNVCYVSSSGQAFWLHLGFLHLVNGNFHTPTVLYQGVLCCQCPTLSLYTSGCVADRQLALASTELHELTDPKQYCVHQMSCRTEHPKRMNRN
jgi:hypothetical protein